MPRESICFANLKVGIRDKFCKVGINKKGFRTCILKPEIKSLAATYSPTLLCVVPLAMKSLTSEFGMGSGISSSPMPPGKGYI